VLWRDRYDTQGAGFGALQPPSLKVLVKRINHYDMKKKI
jgi:hypothetical protein